jgi:hypothetical protein
MAHLSIRRILTMIAIVPMLALGSGDMLDEVLLLAKRRTETAPQYPTEGLIAYYSFESSLDSVHGSAQTLTNMVATNVTQFATGKSGMGLLFSPTNRPYFECNFAATSYPYSVAGWINWDNPAAEADNLGTFGIGKAGASTRFFGHAIVALSGGTSFYNRVIHRATTQRLLDVSSVAHRRGTNQWAHIAIVAPTNNLWRLYLDGVQIGESTLDPGTNLINQADMIMTVGAWSYAVSAAARWRGVIDEVFFYNTELTSNQVVTLYGLHN